MRLGTAPNFCGVCGEKVSEAAPPDEAAIRAHVCDGGFGLWLGEWLRGIGGRPADGLYSLDSLRAAFLAGRRAPVGLVARHPTLLPSRKRVGDPGR